MRPLRLTTIGFRRRRPAVLAGLYVWGLLAALTNIPVGDATCRCHCHDRASPLPGAATLSPDHLESCSRHGHHFADRIDALAPDQPAPHAPERGPAVLAADVASPKTLRAGGPPTVPPPPCSPGHRISAPSRAPPRLPVV